MTPADPGWTSWYVISTAFRKPSTSFRTLLSSSPRFPPEHKMKRLRTIGWSRRVRSVKSDLPAILAMRRNLIPAAERFVRSTGAVGRRTHFTQSDARNGTRIRTTKAVGRLRQSVTAASSFPTAPVPRVVLSESLVLVVGQYLTPYVVRHSEKTCESVSGSQNDSSEQSTGAESGYCFEPCRSPRGGQSERSEGSSPESPSGGDEALERAAAGSAGDGS